MQQVSNATQSTFCPSEFRSVLTLVCQLQPTSVEVVQLLLEAKASPVDCCPLYFAAQAGNSPVMKTLMSAKAPVDPNFGHTRPGFSPLFGAVEHGHNAAVKLLLDAKANPEPVRYDGSTPLYFACQEGMVEIVEMLLQAKSSVDREELEHGIPPLFVRALVCHARSLFGPNFCLMAKCSFSVLDDCPGILQHLKIVWMW